MVPVKCHVGKKITWLLLLEGQGSTALSWACGWGEKTVLRATATQTQHTLFHCGCEKECERVGWQQSLVDKKK